MLLVDCAKPCLVLNFIVTEYGPFWRSHWTISCVIHNVYDLVQALGPNSIQLSVHLFYVNLPYRLLKGQCQMSNFDATYIIEQRRYNVE